MPPDYRIPIIASSDPRRSTPKTPRTIRFRSIYVVITARRLSLWLHLLARPTGRTIPPRHAWELCRIINPYPHEVMP